MKPTIIANDREHLLQLIEEEIKVNGNQCDLNHIDVSKVTKMNGLFGFSNSKFNGDISQWDVSNVTDMSSMFLFSEFNGDISKWNVSDVSDMSAMFEQSKFDKDISSWNVSNVENIAGMFCLSKFSKDTSNWKPYKLKDMIEYLHKCPAPIPYWAIYEGQTERNRVINSYHLNIELNEGLPVNTELRKKPKI
jgi:surface protein